MNPLQRVGAEVLSVGLTLTAVVGCFAAQWFLWNGKPLSALAAVCVAWVARRVGV